MDAVLLARIQFGLTAGFHFLFPPTTLGLTLLLLLFETLYLRTREENFKTISAFLVRILGPVFVLGVATGIVLEFAFGNNWANYSRMVGDIFGAPLAAEGIFAFFLESVFLGVLVFGRDRVSRGLYWLSSFFVFFGAHLSGLWIIIANSWMQTPDGYRLEAGRAVLTDFVRAAVNHSTVVRFLHTITAGWITGALLAAAIAAWLILKKRAPRTAKPLLRASLAVFIIASLLQLGVGHLHSVQVAETQPEKMAAYEALWQTQAGAPFALFGLPDEKAQRTRLYVGVPGMLSFLIHFDADAKVRGLNEFPADEKPPVALPFVSYHLMIWFGLAFIGMALLGIGLQLRKKLFQARWYLRLLILAVPLPYLANEFGWIGAEVGRQPWAVYKVLRTAEAASASVPAGNILFSIIMFSLLYVLLASVGITILARIVRRGPEPEAAEAPHA